MCVWVQARSVLTKALEEEIFELIDPKLGTDYDAYDMQRLIACAAAAVRHTARSRPRMSQVNPFPIHRIFTLTTHTEPCSALHSVQEKHATSKKHFSLQILAATDK